MAKKTIRDIDVKDKRVLVRVDFNVPLDKNNHVSDDTRIIEALPTINYLVEHSAKVILLSHLGRPKGHVNEEYRMDPVAQRLSELLGQEVAKIDDCVGELVQEAIGRMPAGNVILLENVRFHPEEEKNDEKFAQRLAEQADIYVNDAFGTAHRAHASTVGVSEFLPAVAGFLMEKELDILGRLLEHPERPFVAIMGGAKVSDKIAVVSNLLDKVDTVILGGGMSNTFLQAQGYDVGKSLLEIDKVDLAKGLLAKAKNKGVNLFLPTDVVVAPGAAPDAEQKTVPVNQIPAEWMALDIGRKSIAEFIGAMEAASTIVWNGPMGVFEMEPFARGTEAIALAMASSKATTIVGGGDSVSAIKKAGVAEKITHISTGGGASLEFLEGKVLPGVAVLLDK
ncbi:MAG: phosphoglycerate kinase [Peptococcaceae bacterium]|nr:phosphoglycerate kinase [Candidatus Syntrophopropionicum ammoniitolerans]